MFLKQGVYSTLIVLLFAGLPDRSVGASDQFAEWREEMVRDQIEARGISDARVLRAMRAVKRHEFVPWFMHSQAYLDTPLPIGENQTISQPFIVALMTELLQAGPEDRVLEIGTGSGYQAAVLAEFVRQVFTIEIVPALAQAARERLERLGYGNIDVREGDGFRGWPEAAPFDRIIVTAAPEEVPEPLVEQLKVGGLMVVPVGKMPDQELIVIRKKEDGIERDHVIPVRFVPMTGEAQEKVPAGR